MRTMIGESVFARANYDTGVGEKGRRDFTMRGEVWGNGDLLGKLSG